MTNKPIPVADVTSIPPPRDLSPEEELAIIAEYKAERLQDDLDGEYRDFDQQVADGVPAEQLLKELRGGPSQE
jgi:hypothetical protein